MSYGIKIYQSDGQIFDDTAAPLTLVALYTLAADSSGSISFPNLIGYTLVASKVAISATAFGMHKLTFTYPSGIPTISYAPTGGPSPHTATQMLVFAR